jgi:hypothetical protein
MSDNPQPTQPIEGGVNINGDASIGGDVTGRDHITNTTNVNTQGGAHIQGGIQTGGGDFVAGDKITNILPENMPRPGSAPPLPALVVGREEALRDLKARLGIIPGRPSATRVQVLTAVRGWPGVGKTTIAAALAYDPEVAHAFPDGVLWISLGPDLTPDKVLSLLAVWGRALGTNDLLRAQTVDEASAQLAGLLRHKHYLLIVDDAWEVTHAKPFCVGGPGCAHLITTRENRIAQALAPTPDAVYKLLVLSEEKALELLQVLAPTVVAQHPGPTRELVRELEGLPLALQVAGRLLHTEAEYGFGVTDLLSDLRAGAKLLDAQAPADRADLANQTTPTIAALLQKSTDRLTEHDRDCFAVLGVFAPKPATFDLAAIQAVWQVIGQADPKPVMKQLLDRGLLEYVQPLNRYQMHALLVLHAKSLVTED